MTEAGVLGHNASREMLGQPLTSASNIPGGQRRAPSPRPQRPQEIYDGAVADLKEAERLAIISNDHRLRPQAPSRNRPAPPNRRSLEVVGRNALRLSQEGLPPKLDLDADRVSSHRNTSTSAQYVLEQSGWPGQADQSQPRRAVLSVGVDKSAELRRATSAPGSPKAASTIVPEPPKATNRSPSAGPSRLRYQTAGVHPPEPPSEVGASRDGAFRRSRIVRRNSASGGAAGVDEAELASPNDDLHDPIPKPHPPVLRTTKSAIRKLESVTESAVPSPKAAPASRGAQLLVDAVRSKDDVRLAETIINLRGGRIFGPVMGINDLHPVTGRTALYEAVALGRLSLVRQLLEAGADPQVGHATQGTPLLHAAAWGEADIVEALIEAGADLRARDCASYTALHYAAVGGHAGAALALMQAGADVTATNEEGLTPLDLATGSSTIDLLRNGGLNLGTAVLSRVVSGMHASYGSIPDEWQKSLAAAAAVPVPPQSTQRSTSSRSRPASGRRLRESSAKQSQPNSDDVLSSNDSLQQSPGSDQMSPPPKLHLPQRSSELFNHDSDDTDLVAPPLPMCASPPGSPKPASHMQSRSSPARKASTPKVGLAHSPFEQHQPLIGPPGSGGLGANAHFRRPVSGGGSNSIGARATNSPIAQEMATRTASGLGINSGGLQYQAAQMFHQSVEVKTGDISWTRGELLGEGAYGKVYAGLNQLTGELMAVKVLPLNIGDGDNGEDQRQHLASLEHELSLYRRFQHRHIVGYIAAHMDFKTNTMYIFLEYVPGGSIAQMLERFSAFSEELTRSFTRQLLMGLEYLHGCKVIHRDLKGGNVLVTRDGRVKLADFGASKAYHEATITDGMKSIRGSVFWMAPEVIKGTGYGRRADIWSVGCTVIEMLTGKHPWPELADNHWTAMFHIAKSTTGPPMPPDISNVARDFLAQCFRIDPQQRPTVSELLQHPFVAHIPNAFREAEEARDLNHSL